MIEIKKLTSFNDSQKDNILEQVENIFFLSTSIKSFSSDEKKQAFYKRWCRDFQELYPDDFLVAVENNNLVLGYLSGCRDSNKALSEVSVPGFEVFADLFDKFPAHLHINFHPDARGKGLGSSLINFYKAELKKLEIKGLHLVTSPNAQNVSFYQRLDFNETVVRDFNNSPLFFMGCIL